MEKGLTRKAQGRRLPRRPTRLILPPTRFDTCLAMAGRRARGWRLGLLRFWGGYKVETSLVCWWYEAPSGCSSRKAHLRDEGGHVARECVDGSPVRRS